MRSILICGFASLLLVSSNAFAQSDAAKAQAIARYQEGVAFHERGKDEDAYLRFTQAYAVVQTPPILFNLARTEQLTRRRVAASQHFRAYLALPDHPRVTAELRAKAQGFLNELSAQLGHIKPEVPLGATVSVDGKDVAGQSALLDVDAGTHTIGARVGDQKGATEVTVAAGATVGARVVFEGGPVVPVAVAPVPVTPVILPPVSPAVVPPPEVPVQEPYWNSRHTVGVVIAGVGVVGMVVGGIFGAERGSETSDAATALAGARSAAGSSVPARSVCTNPPTAGVASCTALTNALQSNGTDAGLETTLLVGGGVLVVVGAITALWPNASHPSAPSGFVPTVGPHLAGLSWSTSF